MTNFIRGFSSERERDKVYNNYMKYMPTNGIREIEELNRLNHDNL